MNLAFKTCCSVPKKKVVTLNVEGRLFTTCLTNSFFSVSYSMLSPRCPPMSITSAQIVPFSIPLGSSSTQLLIQKRLVCPASSPHLIMTPLCFVSGPCACTSWVAHFSGFQVRETRKHLLITKFFCYFLLPLLRVFGPPASPWLPLLPLHYTCFLKVQLLTPVPSLHLQTYVQSAFWLLGSMGAPQHLLIRPPPMGSNCVVCCSSC